jgi:hypothetical protein
MSRIQIRFNTEKEKRDAKLPAWRVLVDGVEHLAENVRIEAPTWTSEDILPTGQKKWHLSSEGEVTWENTTCVIR